MATWIALFRGINVGGKNILPMKELREVLQERGYTHVKSYIQSGNVVFRGPQTNAEHLADYIGDAVLDNHGFQPRVIVLSVEDLEQAAVSNPFPEAQADPKSLHFYFLSELPKRPDLKALNDIKSRTESFAIVGKVFYLHAPDGIGRSKLAASAERLIGVAGTARNWRTVSKVLELASRN